MFFKYVFLWLIHIWNIWICQLPQITNANPISWTQFAEPFIPYIIICFLKRHIFKLILLLHKLSKVLQKQFLVSVLLAKDFTSILNFHRLIQIISNFSGQNTQNMFNFLNVVVVVGFANLLLSIVGGTETFTQINFGQSFRVVQSKKKEILHG